MTEVFRDIWTELKPHIVSTLILVIVAGGAAVVAWLKSQARRWEAVKIAVREVEESASGSRWPLTGGEKHRQALELLKRSAPGIPEAKASAMIDKAVEQSERPPPLPPRAP